MAMLKKLWHKLLIPSVPAHADLGTAKRQLLAHWLSLLCLAASVFFILYNWAFHQTLLVWINVVMTACYLVAFLVMKYYKGTLGKTILVLSASSGIFLVSSVVGRGSDNYILYFPVIGGVFLLFSIENPKYLLPNLLLPVAGLVLLEWTNYELLINYRAAESSSWSAVANLTVSLVAMGLELYYAQRLSLMAEKALRESEQSLVATIENTTNAIWSIDRESRILTCNTTFKKEFKHGYGVDIEKGVDIFSKVPPDEHALWLDIYHRAFNGERFIKELYYEFPGQVFNIELAVNPIKKADNTVTGISFFSNNITDRKKIEADLRFHANVLAQVNDAVIGMDNQQHITFWNTGAERLYGLATAEAMGKKASEVYATEWINAADEYLVQEMLSRTGSCQLEIKHVLPNGKKIYVATNMQIWHNESGDAIGLLAVNRDITESRKAEDTIRQTNQKLTSLLENSQNSIFAVDQDYKYIAFNHRHRETVKQVYNIDIYLGMSLLQFSETLDSDISKMLTHLERALAGEQFIIIETFGDANSWRRYFERAFTPMLDEADKVVGVTVFSLDVTERIESEEELRRINFELDSFVYRSSHDLRAPLRSVLGLVTLVRAEADAQQRESYLRLMEKSIQKLDTFITDMTDFSRNSRREVNVNLIDFGVIIAECAENLRYMEHADRVDLRVEIGGEHAFYSDPQRISTIFQNLMSNSVKYQRSYISDSYIHFDIQCKADSVQIIYSDNGKGIEKVYLTKIFDMFFRASADSYGSGLGLYITKQVVNKLNGTIEVESEPGQGTRFLINLPNLKTEVPADVPVLVE